jgi:tRNA threonylcarbamoyladenosine biosynthesis protein TsaB
VGPDRISLTALSLSTGLLESRASNRLPLLNILALDTSTEHCSAALWLDGELDVRAAHAGQSHTRLIMAMVDELLKAHGLALDRLDGIAYGEGPGSFTGLRIACGVAQGLAFGANLPVLGVGTLLAMAAGTDAARVVCCVDARMREVYHAAYEQQHGTWQIVHAPTVCAPHEAPALPGTDWFACGSGFDAYREVLLERYGGQLGAIEPQRFPHAREVAALAAPLFAAGRAIRPEDAAPVYLRDKVALRIDERPNR